jgi:thioredoxin
VREEGLHVGLEAGLVVQDRYSPRSRIGVDTPTFRPHDRWMTTTTSSSSVLQVTDDSFTAEVLESDVPVLVDFWAAWCGPCRMLSPLVEEIARDDAGRVKVVKLDVDAAPDIAARFGAQSIPLLLLLRDGHEVDRLVGAVPRARLRAWLEPHLTPSTTASA